VRLTFGFSVNPQAHDVGHALDVSTVEHVHQGLCLGSVGRGGNLVLRVGRDILRARRFLLSLPGFNVDSGSCFGGSLLGSYLAFMGTTKGFGGIRRRRSLSPVGDGRHLGRGLGGSQPGGNHVHLVTLGDIAERPLVSSLGHGFRSRPHGVLGGPSGEHTGQSEA